MVVAWPVTGTARVVSSLEGVFVGRGGSEPPQLAVRERAMNQRRSDRTGPHRPRPGKARPKGRGSSQRGEHRPLTAEDLQIHAWLNERLTLLPRERRDRWGKVGRVLGG